MKDLNSMYEENEDLKSKIQSEMDRIKVKDSKTEVKEDIVVEKTPSVAEEVADPFLEEAIKQGYDPEYKGPNKKSPEQFVKDGSFFRKIDSLKKEQEEMKSLLKQMSEHNQKVEKAAYDKALHDLQKEKLQAVSEGDTDKFIEVEKKAAQLNQQYIPPASVNTSSGDSEAVKAFKERNKSWLDGQSAEDKRMQRYVTGMVTEYMRSNPNIDESLAIKEIEKELKEVFPTRFENPEQSKPALTSKSTVSSETKKSLSDRLTKRQLDFLKRAKSYGSKLTAEDYAKQLQMTGELPDE